MQKFLFLIAFVTLIGNAAEPLYIRHDYIKGSFPILTNTEEYVTTSVEERVVPLEEKIDWITTNIAPDVIIARINRVSRDATNYTESVAIQTKSYADEKVLAASRAATNYTDSVAVQTKGYADGKSAEVLQTSKNYTDSALGEAKTYTDGKIEWVAQESTNYTDSIVSDVKVYADTKASEAAQEATNYTDTVADQVKGYADGKAASAVQTAKNYTDTVSDEVRSYADGIGAMVAQDGTNYTDALETKLTNGSITVSKATDAANAEQAGVASGLKGTSTTRTGQEIFNTIDAAVSKEYVDSIGSTISSDATNYTDNVAEQTKTWVQGLGYATQSDLIGTASALQISIDEVAATVSKIPIMTTNDVCNIVTNRTEGRWSDWVLSPSTYEKDGQNYISISTLAYDDNNSMWDIMFAATNGAGQIIEDTMTDWTDEVSGSDAASVRLVNSGTNLVISANRKWIASRNVLGLAMLTDVPSTNGFVTESITNGLVTSSVTNGLVGSDFISTNSPEFVSVVTNLPIAVLDDEGKVPLTMLPPIDAGLKTNNVEDLIDENISTNNPSFVAAVTNCPVVTDPEYGDLAGYGTIGALLAALVAAIALIRKKKADEETLADEFATDKTYVKDEYVTYNGRLYRFNSDHSAGAWTGSDVDEIQVTAPDATVDIGSDSRLRVVDAEANILWSQGYRLADESSVTLSCDKVNLISIANGTTTLSLALPTVPTGVTGDFIVNIDNSQNASNVDCEIADLTDMKISVVVMDLDDLNDLLTFEANTMYELYFTQTAFEIDGKPTWKLMRQVVVSGNPASGN